MTTLSDFALKCERLAMVHRGNDWRIAGKPPDIYLEISGCRADSVFDCGWVRYRVTDKWELQRDPHWEAQRFGVTRRTRTHTHCAHPGCNRWGPGQYCEAHRQRPACYLCGKPSYSERDGVGYCADHTPR